MFPGFELPKNDKEAHGERTLPDLLEIATENEKCNMQEDKMEPHRDYQYAKNGDIEIRVDFSRPETSVDFRFSNEGPWVPSPFQSAELNHLPVEQVVQRIDEYLDGQG